MNTSLYLEDEHVFVPGTRTRLCIWKLGAVLPTASTNASLFCLYAFNRYTDFEALLQVCNLVTCDVLSSIRHFKYLPVYEDKNIVSLRVDSSNARDTGDVYSLY